MILNSTIDEVAEVAVQWPRIHHQQFPDKVELEPGAIPIANIDKLRSLGHKIEITTSPIAIAPSILRTKKGWIPQADMRRPDASSGGLQ